VADRRGFVAWDEADFHGTDPAAVWVVVGDPDRLPQWAGVQAVHWSGDLPKVGDDLSVEVSGSDIAVRVADWEAGRRYRVELQGVRWVDGAQLECAVESLVESNRPGAHVRIQFGATTERWRVPLVRMMAQRRIKKAVSTLRRLAG